MHTAPQRALDCEPGLDGLNQVYGPNHPIFQQTVKFRFDNVIVVSLNF